MKKIIIYIFICALAAATLISIFFTHKKNEENNMSEITKNTQNNFNKIDLSQYFNGIEGCAVFYSVKNDKYDIYNYDIYNTREIPCSTFKIVSALAGLEYNIIENKDTILKWDGTKQMLKDWEQDLTLKDAFQLSANWYFERIENEIGIEKLIEIVNKIDYGNKDLTGGIPHGETSLKISPMEQIEFIRNLFNYKYDFKKENVDTIKEIMKVENNGIGKLYGKTGTSGTEFLENGNQTAWFVGKYETPNDEYYFALRIMGDKNNENIRGPIACEITKNICNNKYF